MYILIMKIKKLKTEVLDKLNIYYIVLITTMQQFCQEIINQATEKNCTALMLNDDEITRSGVVTIDFISATPSIPISRLFPYKGKAKRIVIAKCIDCYEITIYEKRGNEIVCIYKTKDKTYAFTNTGAQMQEIIEAMAN